MAFYSDAQLLNTVYNQTYGALQVDVVQGNIVGGSGGTASTFGAAFPASGTASGFSDGTYMRAAYVAPFHNSDGQVPSSSQYGLLTGGIAQILDPSGLLDRQRGTGFDGIPAVGVATGTQQMAGPALTTTFGASVTGNASAQSVQVASSTNVQIGDLVKTQDNLEYVLITAIADGTHVTGIFKNNHASGQTLTWYHYNQARDASAGDQISLTGMSANVNYLVNTVSQLAEQERSAAGELDGASGKGTNIAAEYEWNGGGPYNGTAPSGLQFDRGRSLQAKGVGAGTITNNPLAVAAVSLTLNAAPTTLIPGQFILLDRAGANPEGNYVAASYTPGSTTVPLQSATAFAHAQNSTVEWDQYVSSGPGLNGFLAAGVGIEEEALYDPVSNKFYIERSATQDAVAPQNVVMENVALLNPAGTMDRQKGNYDNQTLVASAAYTTTQTSADQTNTNARGVIVVLNMATVGTGSVTLAIQGKDPVSGQYYPILAGVAVTTNSVNPYTVYPGAPSTANVSIGLPLPRTWRVVVTANNANSATYSVGASLIV